MWAVVDRLTINQELGQIVSYRFCGSEGIDLEEISRCGLGAEWSFTCKNPSALPTISHARSTRHQNVTYLWHQQGISSWNATNRHGPRYNSGYNQERMREQRDSGALGWDMWWSLKLFLETEVCFLLRLLLSGVTALYLNKIKSAGQNPMQRWYSLVNIY